MKVAITGASGFVGSSIVEGLKDEFEFRILPRRNLNEDVFVKESLLGVSTMIHLAGISSVGDCETNPREAYQINVGLTCYLAEVFFRQNKGGHFVFTSTGQVYDESEPVPHNEKTKLAPASVYARTKLSAEVALAEIARHFEGRLTILRLYNHTHKSQSTRFVLPSILKQIQDSASEKVILKVGNIDVSRDFSAIQDLVSAFEALLKTKIELPQIEIYNLSSGVDKNLRQVILGLADRAGKRVEFEIDPSRIRANDPARVLGDSSKFARHFEWTSRSQTIEGFLKFFMEDL